MSKTSVQPQSVECVMRNGFSLSSYLNHSRKEHYERRHPEVLSERLARAAAYDAKLREQSGLALPAMQQAALLQMHESPVKRAVIARLLEDCQDKPQAPEYRALVDRGLAVRNLGKRFHDLTPAGIIAAKRLEASLCGRFDIHLLIEGRQIGWQQRYYCTCGKDYLVRRSPTAPGNAHAQWAADHATKDGMTKLVVAMKPLARVEG